MANVFSSSFNPAGFQGSFTPWGQAAQQAQENPFQRALTQYVTNLANTGGTPDADWAMLWQRAQGAGNVEPQISAATDQINSAESAARRQLAQRAAAFGGSRSGGVQAGLRRLGTEYAGLRATAARDIRSGAEDRQLAKMMQAYSLRPKPREMDGGALSGLAAMAREQEEKSGPMGDAIFAKGGLDKGQGRTTADPNNPWRRGATVDVPFAQKNRLLGGW